MRGVYSRKAVLPGAPKKASPTPSCGVDPHMLTSALIYGSRTSVYAVDRTHEDDPARAEYIRQLIERRKKQEAQQ
jgi:hypothetical protein